jgi:hypothetical protein
MEEVVVGQDDAAHRGRGRRGQGVAGAWGPRSWSTTLAAHCRASPGRSQHDVVLVECCEVVRQERGCKGCSVLPVNIRLTTCRRQVNQRLID